jgi:hypothetical protein
MHRVLAVTPPSALGNSRAKAGPQALTRAEYAALGRLLYQPRAATGIEMAAILALVLLLIAFVWGYIPDESAGRSHPAARAL